MKKSIQRVKLCCLINPLYCLFCKEVSKFCQKHYRPKEDAGVEICFCVKCKLVDKKGKGKSGVPSTLEDYFRKVTRKAK